MLFFWLIFSAIDIVVAQNPPPPDYYATEQGPITVPCADGNDGTGGGVSPPPGLCLPINDYLLPLFVAGLVVGAYSMVRIEAKKGL